MAQVFVNKVVLENGQKVYEATCPADPTIKPRRPIKEKKDEVSDSIVPDTPETDLSEDEE